MKNPTSTAAIILCTPKYVEMVASYPEIREIIDQFGKQKPDALHTLLCDGGFGDTALKVVDSHYLIRDYKAILSQDPFLQLPAFIDIFLNLSGANGLGILPDILDLKADYNSKAKASYKELFSELEKLIQQLTIEYYLSNSLVEINEHNVLKEIKVEAATTAKIDEIILALQKNPEAKTSLLLCSKETELVWANMLLERALLNKSVLVLSI